MKIKIDSEHFKCWTFKSGENQVRLVNKPDGKTCIDFRYTGDQSLFVLAQAVDALRRSGLNNLNLFIPYFPGARQDRICANGDSLAVKVYADFINSLKFDSVEVFDPHSDVVCAVVNNSTATSNHVFVGKALEALDLANPVLVSPDAGANKKVFALAQLLMASKVVRADKKRNPATGEITGTTVFEESLHHCDCVIVDDIISGGRTFMSLAEELMRKGASSVHLIVSHHEGVASEAALKSSGIASVTTTDSLPSACLSENNFTKIIQLDSFIP